MTTAQATTRTACGRIDKVIWLWRGRTAYHANCPQCMIVLTRFLTKYEKCGTILGGTR